VVLDPVLASAAAIRFAMTKPAGAAIGAAAAHHGADAQQPRSAPARAGRADAAWRIARAR
jgi:hypothetical protein